MEVNKIYNEDCFKTMANIPDNFVDLVVTSPPYNKGYWSVNRNPNNGFQTKSRKITYGDFDDDLSPEEYENQQIRLLKECLRIIKPTGSIFYNHIDILNNHNTIHPKYVHQFPVKQIIVWNRKNTPKLDESYFFPITEYVFWIKKDSDAKPKFNRKEALFKSNVWDIPPENDNTHPAPFPVKFSSNCILATTDVSDLVYDPYMGSGTTAISCIRTKRNYIGSEAVSEFCQMAESRIKIELSQLSLF